VSSNYLNLLHEKSEVWWQTVRESWSLCAESYFMGMSNWQTGCQPSTVFLD